MRPTSTTSLALLLTAAAAVAQQSPQGVTTDATSQPNTHQAALGGAEGALRYGGDPNFDPANYAPVPMPDPANSRPLPAGFQSRMMSKDLVTGLETIHAAPRTLLPSSMSVAGSAHTGQEPRGRAWTGTLQRRTDEQNFPWRTNARMFFNQTSGSFICSATMLDPRMAITAGHCVHEGNGGAWSTNVRISPAWDGDDDHYGSANGIVLASFSDWIVGGNFNDDMGFVRLDRPVGVLTGWFGYGFDNSNAFFSSTTFNMSGYPGANFTGAPNALYYHFGTMDTVTSEQLRATVGWGVSVGGMSGSGLYDIVGNARTLYGNCSAENVVAGLSWWTRMTQSKFDFLNNTFLPGSYSSIFDIVPLDVTSPNTSVGAGGMLTGLNYDSFNNSRFDPVLRTYTGDVYLSTNDNISTGDTRLYSFTYDFNYAAKQSLEVGLPSALIPANTPPGTYWVGVVNTFADGNGFNDDTDGRDAFQITVTPFLNLPTGTIDASGPAGAIVDFDSLRGVVPSYMSLSNLNAETRLTDPEAFCNIGNAAPPIDPWSGNYSLEMGLLPSSTNTHFVENAMVLRVQGSSRMELDFMGINYGDESDNEDGVFISSSGGTWIRIFGPYDAQVPRVGRWYSATNVDLSGTSVNTSGTFYLAFRQRDNFQFGGADGIGIDDIRIRPTFYPTLTVSNLYGGQTTDVKVTGATGGNLTTLLLSITGPGPTRSVVGNLAVNRDLIVLATAPVNRNGDFTHPVALLAPFRGLRVWLDAVDWGSVSTTTDLDVTIR